jgi:class 3 adenylate cyclase
VNTASRLMSNATPGQIMVSKATADELGSRFQLNALPPLKVKGRVELVEAFSVMWQPQTAKA